MTQKQTPSKKSQPTETSTKAKTQAKAEASSTKSSVKDNIKIKEKKKAPQKPTTPKSATPKSATPKSAPAKKQTPSKKLKQTKASTQAKQKKKAPQKPATPKSALAKKQTPSKKLKKSPSSAELKLSDLQFVEGQLKKLLDQEKEEKLILKDIEGRKYCIVENCDYPAIIEDHCRQHFFSSFQIIKGKRQILDQNQLEKSFKRLFDKQSFKILKLLLRDLSSERNFKLALLYLSEEE